VGVGVVVAAGEFVAGVAAGLLAVLSGPVLVTAATSVAFASLCRLTRCLISTGGANDRVLTAGRATVAAGVAVAW
jgi:hypothetical protein